MIIAGIVIAAAIGIERGTSIATTMTVTMIGGSERVELLSWGGFPPRLDGRHRL